MNFVFVVQDQRLLHISTIFHLVSCFLPDLLLVEFAEELLPGSAPTVRQLRSDVRLHVRLATVASKAG